MKKKSLAIAKVSVFLLVGIFCFNESIAMKEENPLDDQPQNKKRKVEGTSTSSNKTVTSENFACKAFYKSNVPYDCMAEVFSFMDDHSSLFKAAKHYKPSNNGYKICDLTQNKTKKNYDICNFIKSYLLTRSELGIKINGFLLKIKRDKTSGKLIIDCSGTKITDKELKVLTDKVLKGMENQVIGLNLRGCQQITDAGVKYIAGNLKGLKSLNLEECWSITDTGVKYIAENLKGLTNLDLRWCKKITQKAKEELRNKIKGLKIVG